MMLLTPRLDWMLGCCSCAHPKERRVQAESQVQLNTDPVGCQSPKGHSLLHGDSFDITFTPGSLGGLSQNGRANPITPRQRGLRDQLELPHLQQYPVPPTCGPEDDEDEQLRKLRDMYQEFALDLHMGMYLTQLTSNRDYSDIHCQLMDDMTTLQLDQSSGRIIEFPLTNVSKVYRIVREEDRWYLATAPPPGASADMEQIVVVEFMRRKLAFVLQDMQASQRFLICMELLIRRAQQRQALRSLAPTAQPRQAQSRNCPTPRAVQETLSRQRGTKCVVPPAASDDKPPSSISM